MKVPDDGPKVVGFVVGPSSALYGGLGYGAASTSQHLELNVVQDGDAPARVVEPDAGCALAARG
jgi:hypothetical protein